MICRRQTTKSGDSAAGSVHMSSVRRAGKGITVDWSRLKRKALRISRIECPTDMEPSATSVGSAERRQHVLPAVVSGFTRIFDCVLDTVGPYQLTALWTVNGRGRPAGDVDAGVWLLPIALDGPRSRPLKYVADGRRCPGTLSEGAGLRPLLTDGAGIT